MKKRLHYLAVLLLVLTLSSGCDLWYSFFGVPEEEVMSVTRGIVNAIVDTAGNATIENLSNGFRFISGDGSFTFEVEWDSPTETHTQTFRAYSPPSGDFSVTGEITTPFVYGSSGDTLSGTLTGTLDVYGSAITTLGFNIITYVEVYGSGEFDITMNGTVIANGTTFEITGWGLGDLTTANYNALVTVLNSQSVSTGEIPLIR